MATEDIERVTYLDVRPEAEAEISAEIYNLAKVKVKEKLLEVEQAERVAARLRKELEELMEKPIDEGAAGLVEWNGHHFPAQIWFNCADNPVLR